MYFGGGPFWRLQHEFVEAEKTILGRNYTNLTAFAGYAGGTRVGSPDETPSVNASSQDADEPGLVCYHNSQNLADYATLGHTEVVSITIPKLKLLKFAQLYFKILEAKPGHPEEGIKE